MKILPARPAGPTVSALVSFAVLFFHAASVQSHGTQSEVRVLGQSLDGYDVTVRTAPRRPRTGRLHIDVQLIAPDSLTYIDRASITATARLRDAEGHQAGPARSHYRAPWHELELNLQKSGTWDIHLTIDGPRGESETTLRVEILSE